MRQGHAGSRPAPQPDAGDRRRLIDFVAGGTLDDEHLPLLEAELALDGADLRAPAWRVEELAPGRTFRVAVVGAGMSGIVAAHRLRQAGVEVEVFDKNDDVGGTWLENDYPGCRVDIQNHFYSYSFAQTPDWPQFHSIQPVLLEYSGRASSVSGCATSSDCRPRCWLPAGTTTRSAGRCRSRDPMASGATTSTPS